MSRYLIPMPSAESLTIKDYQRFWAKTARTDGCWLWTGCRQAATKNTYGEKDPPYGVFRMHGNNYKAHRAAYFLEYRQDPGELKVCHECNNTLCVRPDHLFLGTDSDNQLHRTDCDNGPKGWKNGRSVLDEKDIPEIMRRHLAGESAASIAQSYGVTKTTIENVYKRRTWRHVPL